MHLQQIVGTRQHHMPQNLRQTKLEGAKRTSPLIDANSGAPVPENWTRVNSAAIQTRDHTQTQTDLILGASK